MLLVNSNYFILGECIALWGERKQVVLCGRCWRVCKWNNRKHVYEEKQSEQRAAARILLNLFVVHVQRPSHTPTLSSQQFQ